MYLDSKRFGVIKMNEFAKRLKTYREKLKSRDPKWTQEYMAEKIGVARVTYTAYEAGTKTPPLETVSKIADVLGVSIDYLQGRTDNPLPIDKQDNLFFFDKEELTDEDIEYIKESIEIIKERARRRAKKKSQAQRDKES